MQSDTGYNFHEARMYATYKDNNSTCSGRSQQDSMWNKQLGDLKKEKHRSGYEERDVWIMYAMLTFNDSHAKRRN